MTHLSFLTYFCKIWGTEDPEASVTLKKKPQVSTDTYLNQRRIFVRLKCYYV